MTKAEKLKEIIEYDRITMMPVDFLNKLRNALYKKEYGFLELIPSNAAHDKTYIKIVEQALLDASGVSSQINN